MMNTLVRPAWLLVMASVLAAGCGPAPTIVRGTVTLDEKPLANAAIEFIPTAGDGQTSHALSDQQGRYVAKVSPTRLTVVIHASQVVGQRKMPEAPDAPPADVHQEMVPRKYTSFTTSDLFVQAVAEKQTTADFSLTSKPR
jgi:hypothetical protein